MRKTETEKLDDFLFRLIESIRHGGGVMVSFSTVRSINAWSFVTGRERLLRS